VDAEIGQRNRYEMVAVAAKHVARRTQVIVNVELKWIRGGRLVTLSVVVFRHPTNLSCTSNVLLRRAALLVPTSKPVRN
jgi:hypothetical protein